MDSNSDLVPNMLMVKYCDREAFVSVTGNEFVGQFIKKACNELEPAPKPVNINLHVSEDSGPLVTGMTMSEVVQEHNITERSVLIMNFVSLDAPSRAISGSMSFSNTGRAGRAYEFYREKAKLILEDISTKRMN
ncbi:hypothetical protein MP638_003344 [Amoeboaphelidium occidentale]|nr:hypothetical protein MP638_003344 [Amoeboaphelidium occidentale]